MKKIILITFFSVFAVSPVVVFAQLQTGGTGTVFNTGGTGTMTDAEILGCGSATNGAAYCCVADADGNPITVLDFDGDGWASQKGVRCLVRGGPADPGPDLTIPPIVNPPVTPPTTTTTSNGNKSIMLTNPLADGNVEDIPTLVKKILEIALKIGAPLIAIAIIYAGYLFIAAQGNPGKLETAKQALIYVVIGAAILLGAYIIAESIVGTVNSIRGN